MFAGRRRASITCPTRCYRDDSYTHHVQHRHTTIVDALDTSDRENRGAGGGKTHRRSMDPSNEFRCRDYLWDRCRLGRRRHRHFVGISRHIPSFEKIRGRMILRCNSYAKHIPDERSEIKTYSFISRLKL